MLENLFGAMTKEGGVIRLHGKEIKNSSPREAIKNGFALLTEERRATGIFGIRDIKENTVISNLNSYLMGSLCLSEKKMKQDTDWAIQAMHIKTPSQTTQIRSLSGGNQQKVIIGRAHPRHRRGREVRDVPADPRPGQGGEGCHHGVLRDAGAAGDL